MSDGPSLDRLDTSMIRRGSTIGRFTVVAELGAGGMGAVYAAHDPQLDRQVALKVMRGVTGDEEDRVRMLREGQAMARVTHPNVITVYEVGTEGGSVFLAQELLDGGNLAEWLEKKDRSREQILDKFVAAGKGLAAAHAAGLVHRDFKPENVLLGKDGRVRVADFGLARSEGALVDPLAVTTKGGGPRTNDHADAYGATSPMSPMTRTGAVLGTPRYMAPEQHEGRRADARSDQFSFCVSLYYALYKAWPYEGKTAPALADAVIEGRLSPPPKGADVPAKLRKVMLRGLSTDPEARYPSMEALLGDLDTGPAKSSRVPLLLASAAVLAIGAAGAVYAVKVMGKGGEKAVPVVATPAPVDVAALTGVKGGAVWMTEAIDQGKFVDAIEKYKMAAALEGQSQRPANAAINEAAAGLMYVQRGDLKEADEVLKQATEHVRVGSVGSAAVSAASGSGSDGSGSAVSAVDALAYVDLGAAALAHARGDLKTAQERSENCAAALEQAAPVLAALCEQVLGEARMDSGNESGARAAFEAGLALANGQHSKELTSTLTLALAQLDIDAGKSDDAAKAAAAVQADCSDRGAVGCETQARILLARVQLTKGDAGAAVDLLEAVKQTSIEQYRTRMRHQIALGEANAQKHEAGDDNVEGLDRIESVRAQAEVRGFVGLVFEAKLARVRVLLFVGDDDAKSEYEALRKEAHSRGFERIVHVAEATNAEIESQPMLAPDGGLPGVRP